LQRAKIKADEIRVNGLSQMEREKQELIHVADEDSKQLEDSIHKHSFTQIKLTCSLMFNEFLLQFKANIEISCL
jgi:hypothetical protein